MTRGSFVGTTNVWDVSEIYSTDINSEEFKELLVRLYQNLNRISLSLNTKDTGSYDTLEFVTGANFFSNPALTSASSSNPTPRPVYRKVINFGTLPASASTGTAAHGLTFNANTSFTRIYGTASDVSGKNFIPIPYVSATTADIVEINIDSTNVNVTVGKDMSAFTKVYIVLEYLKS